MQILSIVQMWHLQVRVRVIFERLPIILIRCKRDEPLHCYLCVAIVILTGSPCPSTISHAFPSGKDYVSTGLQLTQVKARTSIVVAEAATRTGSIWQVRTGLQIWKDGRAGSWEMPMRQVAKGTRNAQVRRDFLGTRFLIFRRVCCV